jgi:hypothetical protein
MKAILLHQPSPESVAARQLLHAKISLDKKPVWRLVFSIQFGSISYLRAARNKT